MPYDCTKRLVKKRAREAKAEQLLRGGEFSAKELARALPYELSHTRVLLHDLMGRERDKRRVYISGWDVNRKLRGYSVTPRFRWITGAEANRPRPDKDECARILATQPAAIRAVAMQPASHSEMMAALYGKAA